MTNANKFNLLLDVVKLMHSLADGLEAVAYAFADSQEIFVEAKEVSKPVETGQPTKQIAAEKTPSLADVRAVLAVKTQNGMTAEVKGLITKYGGTKLSDVDPKHYADLIKDAEVLGNGYRQLPKAKLVGCWAHVRRKFFEATPKQADKQSLGRKGLAYCDQMFSLEASWAELPSAERLCKRKERLAPLMTTFFDWCRNQSVLPGSKLGRAITYALKYEETFKTVLTDGSLVLSNNLAERAIKGLVMGRKNWLFSQSFEGAKSSAIILSLLETAKRNGLDSEKYLTYLLEKLPNEESFAKKAVLEAYLPWSETVQADCK